MHKSTLFRQRLKTRRNLLLGGAHDALSAKLIEEAGYDAVWASSFGISASTKCLPDANVLTMTEALEAVKGMNDAISIPLIADCDNGYGNAHNVMRVVREYERAGIAGISVEDNPFPKKCSLYPGQRPELVDRDEMAGRIQAAKHAQRHPDFFVIARTEALIAGLGMEEALGRARAYEQAGADAILIHSRQSTPDEIRAFAARWKGRVPLVAVPTKYPDVTTGDLARMGIRIAIFANQALRASVVAMRRTLETMRRRRSLRAVERDIAPLSEVFRLVGQPDLERNDLEFVRRFTGAPRAVIVAAGYEKAFWPLNADKPKAMLEIRGKSLLERQVEILRAGGVERVAVVTGYKRDKVVVPGIVKYPNPRYRQTHILHSLFCAEPELRDKFLFLYGDVLFEDHVLEKLLRSRHDVTIVVHRPRRDSEISRPKPQRDWAVLDSVDREGIADVVRVGHHLPKGKANGEFIGLALFSKRGAQLLTSTVRRLEQRNGHRRFHNAESLHRAQLTDILQELIDRGEKVKALCIHSGWLDIDSFEDYRRAWQSVKA